MIEPLIAVVVVLFFLLVSVAGFWKFYSRGGSFGGALGFGLLSGLNAPCPLVGLLLGFVAYLNLRDPKSKDRGGILWFLFLFTFCISTLSGAGLAALSGAESYRAFGMSIKRNSAVFALLSLGIVILVETLRFQEARMLKRRQRFERERNSASEDY